MQKKRKELSSSSVFRNERGAIDLASIMVGIIVIGLIGGTIAATIFAVIPWAQDNAAKQQLDSIVSAENAYMGMSSAVPSPLPAGYATNSFADSAGLSGSNLLQAGSNYCVVTANAGKSYQGYAASSSGNIWSVNDQNSNPISFTGTLPTSCQFITSTVNPPSTPVPTPTDTLPPASATSPVLLQSWDFQTVASTIDWEHNTTTSSNVGNSTPPYSQSPATSGFAFRTTWYYTAGISDFSTSANIQNLVVGKNYRITGYIYKDSGTPPVNIRVGSSQSPAVSATGIWTKTVVEFTAVSTTQEVKLYTSNFTGSSATTYYDNIKIERIS